MPRRTLEDGLGMSRRWLRRRRTWVNQFWKTPIFLRGGQKCPKVRLIIEGVRGYEKEQKLSLRVHFLVLKMEIAKRNIWKSSADWEKGGKNWAASSQSLSEGQRERVSFQKWKWPSPPSSNLNVTSVTFCENDEEMFHWEENECVNFCRSGPVCRMFSWSVGNIYPVQRREREPETREFSSARGNVPLFKCPIPKSLIG